MNSIRIIVSLSPEFMYSPIRTGCWNDVRGSGSVGWPLTRSRASVIAPLGAEEAKPRKKNADPRRSKISLELGAYPNLT